MASGRTVGRNRFPSRVKEVRLPQNISLLLLGGADAKKGEASKAIISNQFQDGL